MKNLKSELITKNPKTRLYQIPVPIIGLTGGIGTGKSTVAELFKKINIPVIDADQLVKKIYQMPDTFAFIKKKFPQAILENKIIFPKLREIIFYDQKAKELLEKYIYTLLPFKFKEAYLAFKNPTFLVYDVPLLFEKNLNNFVDLSICVYAPRELQIERMIARDQSNKELAVSILSQQIDIEEKKRLSDFVIINTGGFQDLESQFQQLLMDIT